VTSVNILSPSGATGEEVELPEKLFGARVNIPLIHQVVVA
jgi:large subunit ribosomal protein L4